MVAKIAVVDDEAVVRELIGRVLENRGYSVRLYDGANAAYDALYDEPPQLLVTDVNMPDGNGLELVSRLRDRHGRSFPVIVLSTLRSEQDFVRGYAAGADDYLSKPFSRGELLAKVAVLLSRANQPGGGAADSGEDELPARSGLAFGRFELLSVMGQGTYGTVYHAKDTHHGEREVALKVLSALHGAEPANRLRFLRETYALSAVRDDNVVNVVDFGVEEGRLYYAMERVAGPTLKQHVERNGTLCEREVAGVVRGLAMALDALHRADLVHRDLKPSNVILREGRVDEPILVDFGLAKRTFDRGVTDPLTLMGTPGYIAPEVILGDEADHQSDLFALGLVVRYSLTAEEIFPHLKSYELLNRIARGPIPMPKLNSEELSSLLNSMVRVDRRQRIPSAAEALATLAGIPAESLSSEPFRRAKRRVAQPNQASETATLAPWTLVS